jgi:predicted O-linked N-acetylglucosamine transferase (SPINDLY family)
MGNALGERAFQNARLKKNRNVAATELCERAFALQRSGLLSEAQAVYRQLLTLAPHHFDALHQLGRLQHGAGSYCEAEALLARAVKAAPRSAEAHMHHGMALGALGRFEEARARYLRALTLNPYDVFALNNLGIACRNLKLPEKAIESYDRAIAIRSDIAEIHYNRGLALLDLTRYEESIASFDRAIAINPRHQAALSDRGNAFFFQINYQEALASFERALAINPDYAEALSNRAAVRLKLGKPADALADADRAIERAPALVRAWESRAEALLQLNRVSEAIASCERAIAESAGSPSPAAIVILGMCLAQLGQTGDALASFDMALRLKPDFEFAISNRIFLLDFVDEADFEVHRDARGVWWEQVGSHVAALPPYRHSNNRDPERRLVLGFVSADFFNHSAALAFGPAMRRHDRGLFEIVCYSSTLRPDGMTEEFRRTADRWHDVSQWSDTRLAAQIRADAVDILIDLSGHTKGNRLRLLAQKPAPVQVHGWGHVIPPGLPTIDYVLADPVMIPPEVRHLYGETIYDLPCVLTTEPLPAGVSHGETPALANGFVTFGVFNRINKISDAAAALWARILAQVPQSRLLIKHHALDDPAIRGSLLARFARHGAPVERIDFLGSSARVDHLSALNRVDISLDPFPANGGASTWESLQMGVPVIAKLGNAPSSRAAAAILTAIGMREWIAQTEQQYLDIAVARAAQIEALAQTRRALPGRIAASPAGNPALYAEAVDQAYRAMWRTYCAREAAAGN